nr:NAD(P)-binding domain-containing protein [Nocardioides agariphilus]
MARRHEHHGDGPPRRVSRHHRVVRRGQGGTPVTTTIGAGDTVGIVGVGRMGAPMARRLAQGGITVRAFDPAPAATAELRGEAGVEVVDDVLDVVTGSHAVLLMLPSSDVVEAVLLGDGLLAATDATCLLVDMGSSEPARTRALSEDARKRGVTFVDAPVSGGVRGAVAGALTIMVGGPPEVMARLLPVFELLGSNVVHAGSPVGAGHAVKALNNLLSGSHLLATSEALLAAREFGLDVPVVLDIINASSGKSGSTEVKWPRFVLPETYDSGFALRLMLKDMRAGLALEQAVGVPAPLGLAAVQAWEAAADALPAAADHTEIARWLERPAAPPGQPGRPPEPGAGMTLTSRQQEIKDEFVALRGTWGTPWRRMLELDPEFLHAYLQFSAVPWRKNHLDAKTKEFMYIAVDAAATHLYEPGIRQHVRAALDLGATPGEIMEVIELTSTLGIHACNIGVPLLLEVLEEEGLRDGPGPLDEHQERLKAEFTENRGYWHEFWEGLLELDPELFATYVDFSSHPWLHGTLEPKVREFVYIAFDAAATHLYVPGLKLHMRNALRLGATQEEIVEVLEIASVIGIHAATVAAPILAEEIERTPAATTP